MIDRATAEAPHPSAVQPDGPLPDVPVPLWSAGLDGARHAFNPAWLAWTGRTFPEERGHGWLGGVHPDDRERCRQAYAAPELSGDVCVEYRLRDRDGTFRRVRETARPRRDRAGAPTGFAGTCAVIDERESSDALAEAARSLREAQHRARNTVQVTLSLLNLYARAMPPDAAELFSSLVRRIRAIGIVGGGLPENPDATSVDLTDYLQQIVGPLSVLHGATASVTVEGARAELPPPRAHAVGMVVAEIVGACLRPAERVREGVRVLIGKPADSALRISVSGEAAEELDAPPKLGERLTAAYAMRAGAELRRSEGLTELVIPLD